MIPGSDRWNLVFLASPQKQYFIRGGKRRDVGEENPVQPLQTLLRDASFGEKCNHRNNFIHLLGCMNVLGFISPRVIKKQ